MFKVVIFVFISIFGTSFKNVLKSQFRKCENTAHDTKEDFDCVDCTLNQTQFLYYPEDLCVNKFANIIENSSSQMTDFNIESSKMGDNINEVDKSTKFNDIHFYDVNNCF
ncbi:hypothetical protein H311_04148 [Anncaliia algerae PRA109]|nr:hypothetical protein H311_04148 [Anncaliia algerae PRA109]